MKLGERLRQRRLELKLTQAQVSFRTAISEKHISDVENEIIVPRIERLLKFARCYGLEMNEILSDIEWEEYR